MTRRRAGNIRAELFRLWQENPLLSSRDLVAKFKKLHGVTPNFDLPDVVDYGLMQLAGQIAKTPFIDPNSPDFLDAVESDPQRRGIKRVQTFYVREGDVVKPRKFLLDDLTPEFYRGLDIVDDVPKGDKKKGPSQKSLIEAEVRKMEDAGMSTATFKEFLLKGG